MPISYGVDWMTGKRWREGEKSTRGLAARPPHGVRPFGLVVAGRCQRSMAGTRGPEALRSAATTRSNTLAASGTTLQLLSQRITVKHGARSVRHREVVKHIVGIDGKQRFHICQRFVLGCKPRQNAQARFVNHCSGRSYHHLLEVELIRCEIVFQFLEISTNVVVAARSGWLVGHPAVIRNVIAHDAAC